MGMHEEARDDLDDLYERETPFWRVMMPILITVVLFLAAFAVIAWLVWEAGFIDVGGGR
jgi:hypothetical protein